MDGGWDQILERLDRLDKDASRIGNLITSLSSDLQQAWAALAKVRDELKKAEKQAATLRALSPPRYARAG